MSKGYLALPSGEERAPAVMVIPSWWGLNDFFKQCCDRLTQAGFVAFAPDLYNGKVAETVEDAETYRDEIDWQNAATLLSPSLEELRQHPRVRDQSIGVIGFSLGAFMGLSLMEAADIRALVIFYGTGQGKHHEKQTAVQGHFAESDPYEDHSEIEMLKQSLKESGMDTTFYTYPGTTHWFFESDQSSAYNKEAAQLAWERTLEFLRKHLPG